MERLVATAILKHVWVPAWLRQALDADLRHRALAYKLLARSIRRAM
jgi:hypothetical protein